MKCLIILLLLLSGAASAKNMLLIRGGVQQYVRGISSANPSDTVLYVGSITKEQEDHIGALYVENGIVKIDQELKDSVKAADDAEKAVKSARKQAIKDNRANIKQYDCSTLSGFIKLLCEREQF